MYKDVRIVLHLLQFKNEYYKYLLSRRKVMFCISNTILYNTTFHLKFNSNDLRFFSSAIFKDDTTYIMRCYNICMKLYKFI